MADIPRIQQPYANVTVPQSKAATSKGGDEEEDKVPIGPRSGKMARAALILKGLAGAK